MCDESSPVGEQLKTLLLYYANLDDLSACNKNGRSTSNLAALECIALDSLLVFLTCCALDSRRYSLCIVSTYI